MSEITEIGTKARAAAGALVGLSTEQKNNILLAMAEELDASREKIKAANAIDLKEGREAKLGSALMDRLELTDKRLDAMIQGVKEIAELPDPVGAILSTLNRPNGLVIEKVRVPIGVIAIIFESRPNVTADAATLCFKSSNAVILRGGKEAKESNRAIAEALSAGGEKMGMPKGAIQLIQTTDRAAVKELVQLEKDVDVVIPRGGESLIKAVTDMATIPVLKHYKGVCHIYVDESADRQMTLDIIKNAKVQRPGVCNAVETVLVHKSLAESLVPEIVSTLDGVEIRGDEVSQGISSSIKPATLDDWDEEYLDLILSLKVVDSIEDAIAHIGTHGSRHTDAIITSSDAAAKKFQLEVDTATCMVNASTRFSDGSVFGMGAEIGISTDKLHARGPMGLEELCTYKFLVHGTGQVRE